MPVTRGLLRPGGDGSMKNFIIILTVVGLMFLVYYKYKFASYSNENIIVSNVETESKLEKELALLKKELRKLSDEYQTCKNEKELLEIHPKDLERMKHAEIESDDLRKKLIDNVEDLKISREKVESISKELVDCTNLAKTSMGTSDKSGLCTIRISELNKSCSTEFNDFFKKSAARDLITKSLNNESKSDIISNGDVFKIPDNSMPMKGKMGVKSIASLTIPDSKENLDMTRYKLKNGYDTVTDAIKSDYGDQSNKYIKEMKFKQSNNEGDDDLGIKEFGEKYKQAKKKFNADNYVKSAENQQDDEDNETDTGSNNTNAKLHKNVPTESREKVVHNKNDYDVNTNQNRSDNVDSKEKVSQSLQKIQKISSKPEENQQKEQLPNHQANKQNQPYNQQSNQPYNQQSNQQQGGQPNPQKDQQKSQDLKQLQTFKHQQEAQMMDDGKEVKKVPKQTDGTVKEQTKDPNFFRGPPPDKNISANHQGQIPDQKSFQDQSYNSHLTNNNKENKNPNSTGSNKDSSKHDDDIKNPHSDQDKISRENKQPSEAKY